ncbi:DGQHR domain-containing protein [Agarivorans sp. MS3-6]
MKNFFETAAIYVNQPFGGFYIAAIPVSKLIEVCYSFPAVYGDEILNGVQRGLNKKRIKDISEYSQTDSALFPNSIILSANILKDGTTPEEGAWEINDNSELIIPTNDELASIVDGQHRIEGLKKALNEGELDEDFSVVCAIYFELTSPQQAEVFATINFNQQKVDKSLAYQLFGYDLDSTESDYWAPDTLAIYFSRLLNKEKDSAFYNKVNFGMKKKVVEIDPPKTLDVLDEWSISTSTIVEGITRLISTNPTADRYVLHKKKIIRNKREVLNKIKSNAPLREYYIKNQDGQLYDLVNDYFNFWRGFAWNNRLASFMYKTIGIQALFDVLRELTKVHGTNIQEILRQLEKLDIKKIEVLDVNFSGIGRGQIRDELKEQLDL